MKKGGNYTGATFIPIYMEQEDFKNLIRDYVKEALDDMVNQQVIHESVRKAWGEPKSPAQAAVDSLNIDLGESENAAIKPKKTIEQKRAERLELKKQEQQLIDALPDVAEVSSLIDDFLGSPFFRRIYELIKVHGTMREVSRQTGISVSTISRAMKTMKGRVRALKLMKGKEN